MQTIETRYHGATNTKPSKMTAVASGGGGRVSISYDHSLDTDANHAAVAKKLKDKLHWKGKMRGGHTKHGMVWIFVEAGPLYEINPRKRSRKFPVGVARHFRGKPHRKGRRKNPTRLPARSWFGEVHARSGVLIGGVKTHRSSRFASKNDAANWLATILHGNMTAGRDASGSVKSSHLPPEIGNNPKRRGSLSRLKRHLRSDIREARRAIAKDRKELRRMNPVWMHRPGGGVEITHGRGVILCLVRKGKHLYFGYGNTVVKSRAHALRFPSESSAMATARKFKKELARMGFTKAYTKPA